MTYAELKAKMYEYRMGRILRCELEYHIGIWQGTYGWKYRRLNYG